MRKYSNEVYIVFNLSLCFTQTLDLYFSVHDNRLIVVIQDVNLTRHRNVVYSGFIHFKPEFRYLWGFGVLQSDCSQFEKVITVL